MNSVLNNPLREKIDLPSQGADGKVITMRRAVALLMILAIGLCCGFQTPHNPARPKSQTESREKADAVLGQAAVEAAAAGDYDAADDFLNYVASDDICDDYSETASLKLLTLGKNDEAIAIAYKIEGITRRDRLLEQIECEAGGGTEIQEGENR